MSEMLIDYCRVCLGRDVYVIASDHSYDRTVTCLTCGSATIETDKGLRIYGEKRAQVRLSKEEKEK